MAYSRVTRASFGRNALMYAEGHGVGHNGHEERNECVTPINLLPGIDYADQMEPYWLRARKNHTTQILRIVQSFSTSEFDPANSMDILTANLVGQELVRQHYPDRQAVVFTQIDGKGGKVHNHVFISDVSLVDYKGCTPEQTHYKSIEKWTDEIVAQYTQLDLGKSDPKEKLTQTERAKRETGKYVMKDDIRDRVKASMEHATSEKNFIERCAQNGLGVTVKDNKSHGHYYTYELLDFSNVPSVEKTPKNTKARSYSLGGDYGYEALMEHIRQRETELHADMFGSMNTGGHHRKHDEETRREDDENQGEQIPVPEENKPENAVISDVKPKREADGSDEDEQSGSEEVQVEVSDVNSDGLQSVNEVSQIGETEPRKTEKTVVPKIEQASASAVQTDRSGTMEPVVTQPVPHRKKYSEMTPEERAVMFAEKANKQDERNRRRAMEKEREMYASAVDSETNLMRELGAKGRDISGLADEITERVRQKMEGQNEYGE